MPRMCKFFSCISGSLLKDSVVLNILCGCYCKNRQWHRLWKNNAYTESQIFHRRWQWVSERYLLHFQRLLRSLMPRKRVEAAPKNWKLQNLMKSLCRIMVLILHLGILRWDRLLSALVLKSSPMDKLFLRWRLRDLFQGLSLNSVLWIEEWKECLRRFLLRKSEGNCFWII